MIIKTVQCSTVRRCGIIRCNLQRHVTHVDGHSKWIGNARRVAPLQPETQTLTLSLILMLFIHSVILDMHAATHTHTHTHTPIHINTDTLTHWQLCSACIYAITRSSLDWRPIQARYHWCQTLHMKAEMNRDRDYFVFIESFATYRVWPAV